MNKYILIIDDDPISNYILENLINKIGTKYLTISVTDTDNGLKFMRENKENILLLFLDLNMPKLEGWDLLNLVKNDNLITYPVYIVSSSINENDLVQVSRFTDVSDYLIKPIEYEQIKNILTVHDILK